MEKHLQVSDEEIALFVYALRETKRHSKLYSNDDTPSREQLRRLYMTLEPMLEKRSLKKAVLQAITGLTLYDPFSGKISAYQLTVGYVSLLITELEVDSERGHTRRELVSAIEGKVQSSTLAQAWRIFDRKWIRTNLPGLRLADQLFDGGRPPRSDFHEARRGEDQGHPGKDADQSPV